MQQRQIQDISRPNKYAQVRIGAARRMTPKQPVKEPVQAQQVSKPSDAKARRAYTAPKLKLSVPSGPVALALQSVSTSQSQFAVATPYSHIAGNGTNSARSVNSLLRKFMYGFAGLVLAVSMFASVQSLFVNQQASEQIATLGVTTESSEDEQGVTQGTGSEPSEEIIPDQAVLNYTVANPEHPRFLRIPKLDVFARVKALGVDSNGAVDAPWNIHDVGWFQDSTRPGNPNGSSLLLAHVSGWSGPGVFKHLDRLESGDRFTVEKGSGDVVEYEVYASEDVGVGDLNMADVLSAEVQGEHDLKLMTCSGAYNKDTETYENRYIVYAKPVN